jgi:hypothetical protein
VDRSASLEHENGQQQAGLERLTGAPSLQDASTAVQASETTHPPFTPRWRSWAVYSAVVLMVLVMVAVLVWAVVPR